MEIQQQKERDVFKISIMEIESTMVCSKNSDGYYNIVNRNSNMVLQIEDKATSAGAFCIQSTNDGNISQKWIIQVVE